MSKLESHARIFSMSELLNFDLIGIIQTFGYIGLFIIIFSESGLFFGFFLPGDSLLFTAGLLAASGFLNIYLLIPLLLFAAIVGDNVGYWFGKTIGPKIFNKEHSFFFNKRHIGRAKDFYEKYGSRAVILARFVPIVRTFTPILAGVGEMRYPLFVRYNIIGGMLWAAGVTLLGYLLGNTIPNIDQYLPLIVLGIIFISFLPIILEIIKTRKLVD